MDEHGNSLADAEAVSSDTKKRRLFLRTTGTNENWVYLATAGQEESIVRSALLSVSHSLHEKMRQLLLETHKEPLDELLVEFKIELMTDAEVAALPDLDM